MVVMNFVTHFDCNYLNKGIVMYQSLQKTTINFHLFIVCLDRKVELYFEKYRKDNIEKSLFFKISLKISPSTIIIFLFILLV